MTMAVRRESVEIRVDSNLASVATRDAAAVALLRRELDSVNGHPFFQANSSGNVVQVNRSVQQTTQSLGGLNQQSTRTNASLNQTGQSINQLTGRLGLFADAALILGPGLIPIAAVGVQALGGLTAAATAAAVAGGSAIVAFQGVGDALKALQAYRDDPTGATLEKARDAIKDLAPEARQFIFEFQKFKPVLAGIRNEAAAGWFPGLTASLEDFERLAPRIESIFFAAGQAGGSLVDDVAGSLASERWAPFLEFIEEEVPTAMTSLTQIMGDLTHGAAEMFMSFDPGNDAFLEWLEGVADGFDRWASSGEGREDIEAFLAYARENGPEVAELFTSLVGALTAIVKAAAPLGGPVLTGLTAVANMVKVIAESDLATPLLAGVAALRLMQRVQGVVVAGQVRLNSSIRTTATTAMTAQQAAAMNATGLSGTALGAALAAPRPQDVRAQQRAQRAMYARGAGMAAGVGLLASGAASEVGLTNTAMLTLAGTMAGPWGAAVGAGAGLMMDFSKHTNEVEAAQANLNSVLANSASSFRDIATAEAQVMDARDSYRRSHDSAGDLLNMAYNPTASNFDPLETYKVGFDAVFGGGDRLKSQTSLTNPLTTDASKIASTFISISRELGDLTPFTMADIIDPDVEQIEGIVAQVEPQMRKLGVSITDVAAMDDGDLKTFIDDMVELTKTADTPAGYINALSDVISNNGDVMLTAAGRADALRTALDDLLNPQMGLTQATDNWTTSLRTLNDDLAANRTLVGKSDSAIKNRAAVQERIVDLTDKLVAQARAGAGSTTLAKTLRQESIALLDQAESLGVNRRELRRFLTDQGLSGKVIQQVMRTVRKQATDTRNAVQNAYGSLPPTVQTQIKTKGVPTTEAQIDRLVKKYHLTEEQREALVTLKDEASSKAGYIKRLIDSINSKEVTVRVNVQRSVSAIQNAIKGPFGSADGSTVPKTGLPYADRHLYLLADGEEVISNRNGQADRHRGLLKAINSNKLADGGTTGDPFSFISNAALKGMGSAALQAEYRANMQALKEFQKQLKQSTSALERERQKREDFIAYRTEVGQSLTSDLTGNGLAGLDAGVAATTNDSRSAAYALLRAKRKGLDGPLFDVVAASGDLNLMQQLAALSSREIAQRERRYGAATSAQNALGNFAAQERYDTTFKGLSKEIRDLNRINRKLGKAVEKGAERGTRLGNERKSRRTSTGTRAGR